MGGDGGCSSMDEPRADVHSIIRKFLLVGAFAYLVGGWLVIGGLFAPELVPSARVPGWVLGLAGAFFVLLGWLAFSYGPRWYRRASWVVQTVTPSVMHLKIQISYDTDRSRWLRALLRPESADAATQPEESLSMQWPSWDIETLPEGPVEVYRDPLPGGPVVIRTARGWLWSAPGSGFKSRGKGV